MAKYINLDLNLLIDMLTDRTTQFCSMRADGCPDEEKFAHCWRDLLLIQQAIKQKIAKRDWYRLNPKIIAQDQESPDVIASNTIKEEENVYEQPSTHEN